MKKVEKDLQEGSETKNTAENSGNTAAPQTAGNVIEGNSNEGYDQVPGPSESNHEGENQGSEKDQPAIEEENKPEPSSVAPTTPTLHNNEPEVFKTPSFGQKLVGISFNPSGLDEVGYAKNKCANLIDTLHDVRKSSTSAQKNALASQAIDAILVAQMLAVKCLTWQD